MRGLIGILFLLASTPLFAQQTLVNPYSGRQVRIEVRLIEIDRTRLRDMGVDIEGLRKSLPAEKNARMMKVEGKANGSFFSGRDGAAQFLVALERNKLGKTLSAPTLLTTVGRPAHFEFGDDASLVAKMTSNPNAAGFVGAKFNAIPRLTKDGKIGLEVELQARSLDPNIKTRWQGQEVPTIHTETANSTFYLASGETVLLEGGQRLLSLQNNGRKPSDAHQTELIALIKAELVEPAATTNPATEKIRR